MLQKTYPVLALMRCDTSAKIQLYQLAKWTSEGFGTKNEGLYSEKKQTKKYILPARFTCGLVSFSYAFAGGVAYDSLLRGSGKSRQNLCRLRVVKLHSFDTFLISLVQAIMQVTKRTSKASKAANVRRPRVVKLYCHFPKLLVQVILQVEISLD